MILAIRSGISPREWLAHDPVYLETAIQVLHDEAEENNR